MRARWCLALALLAGCPGDDDGPADPDAAPADAEPIDAPHVCAVPADLGDATLTAQQAAGLGVDHAMPVSLVYYGELGGGAALQLELLKGYGVFLDNIVPGTYPLAGDDLDYELCGLCVRLFGDDGNQQYFVTGGTVEITAIDPDLTGSVTSLTFTEVAPEAGACASAIGSASFAAPVTW